MQLRDVHCPSGQNQTQIDELKRIPGIPLQTGRLNISQNLQDWSCSSGCSPPQYCPLSRCTNIVFPDAFKGSGTINVHVTVSHGEKFSRVHSPSATWVQSVTTLGFEVCSRESGIGSDGTGIINWLAFQDHPKITHGRAIFDGIWTTETKCDKVIFSQSFPKRPFVFVSARYTRDTKPDDAMYVWLENVSSRSFEVCIREFLPFNGKHKDTTVDWFAFFGAGSELSFTLSGEAYFSNNFPPKAEENYGFCQDVRFNTTFYALPVALVSVQHIYNPQVSRKSLISPKNNIISAWVEEVSLISMKICVKDLSGTGKKHDPLSVSYVVIGDLDPCLNVFCPLLGACKTYSAHEASCVCNENCPSYQNPVCTESGTTYDNECLYRSSQCKGMENNTLYHPGACEGFPILHGRVKLLRVSECPESSCETVVFPPYSFYPNAEVHVQITLNHMSLNDSVTVHHAITSWTEKVNTQNFTICAMQSGRNGYNINPFATIDWMAYQGAPPQGTTGRIKMTKWWSGTNCAYVTFPKNKFHDSPYVLVTSNHQRSGKEHDAALIWTEDVTKDSFKACLRELQNFDGKHQDIYVTWLAFAKLHKPFFTEYGSVNFPNTNPPRDEDNNAYCEFVHFTRGYNATPSVQISATHSTTMSGNLAPVHNGISTWIENMNVSGFRVCIKELHETRYDPVSVSYAVLTDICDPGWSYYNGFCYFTSDTCEDWTTAVTNCRQENSVLVDVKNNEENVYIQHRHNGERSWLGLNDRSTEGNFTWTDRGHVNFTAWAKTQPNNFKKEDCVLALGVKHNYEWNDVQCSDCNQFTCKKDLNECQNDLNYCHKVATCTNERGSYNCECRAGYPGDGFDCLTSSAGLGQSVILADDGNYLKALANWLKPVVLSQSSYWKNCWRASLHGWAAYTFHSLCDNKGPTVTIIRVGKYIFGGYTSKSWSWGPVKLPQTGKYSYHSGGYRYHTYSTYSCAGNGPSFGGGYDIYISPYASSNNSSGSNLGYTYSPPYGHSYGSSFAQSFLAGSRYFQPDEVEVFYETT
ncbi:Aggrecan core protein [Stylophora pistillata]|uniref:Aggrecan core protein n=1 Tax=Stylophora pistillata TaxID=50429 RepID=A0A2B4RB89_STYPI|nr:Aggrecan core protein [Stylophora pistillata]